MYDILYIVRYEEKGNRAEKGTRNVQTFASPKLINTVHAGTDSKNKGTFLWWVEGATLLKTVDDVDVDV